MTCLGLAQFISHLERMSLGTLLLPKLSTRSVFDRITINQGYLFKGAKESAFTGLVTQVLDLAK